MIRVLLPFLCGILLGIALSEAVSLPVCTTSIPVLAAGFTVFFLTLKLRYSLRWIPGLILNLSIAFSGAALVHNSLSRTSRMESSFPGSNKILLGEITEPPVQKERTTKVVVRVIGRMEGRGWRIEDGKALLYIHRDDASRTLFYGDRIFFRGELKEPAAPTNPGGYDQRRACFLKGITLTGYIPAGKWIRASRPAGFSIVSFALRVREKLLRIFLDTGLKGREFAVASALLFGYTDEIDSELYADFSATGTIHILSVSGMHVGVIFLFLEKFLGFMTRFRQGNKLRSGLILVIIWFYAMLTGLSPAVLRAAAMLSFIIAGKSLKRNPEIFNILAASAIALLAVNPVLVLDIGFELSYLAVTGIVLFYKPVYDLYVTSQWLADKLWSLAAVSIAAQLATTPLSLYYFHRFPNYFMLANMVVVPLSTLIIYGGILLLAFSPIPYLSSLLATGFSFLVNLMNALVHIIGNLPGAVSDGIRTSGIESILMYGVLIALFLFFMKKSRSWLFLALGLCILCSVLRLSEEIRIAGRREMIVYNTRNQGLAGFTCYRECILVSSGRGEGNPFFGEALKRSLDLSGIHNNFRLTAFAERRFNRAFERDSFFFMRGHFIGFRDKRIVLVDRRFPKGFKEKIKVDFIILTGNPRVKLEEMRRIFPSGLFIMDATNSSYRINEWRKEATGLKIMIYSIPDSGTFITE